jgi:hypothetical protein
MTTQNRAPWRDERQINFVDDIENEMATLVSTLKKEEQKPTRPASAIPADLVKEQYEQAAQELEALGPVLTELAQQCEQVSHYLSDVIKHVSETVAHCREEATVVSHHISIISQKADVVKHMSDRVREELISVKAINVAPPDKPKTKAKVKAKKHAEEPIEQKITTAVFSDAS